jgi:hypothetical protein
MNDEQSYKTSPIVGYVRSARKSDPQLDQLDAQIRRYASERGYNLAAVFREEGVSGVAVHRPVLDTLLLKLDTCHYAGVVVPTLCHLSAQRTLLTRTIARIHENAWLDTILPNTCNRF